MKIKNLGKNFIKSSIGMMLLGLSLPVLALDHDGDGKFDHTVFRPSDALYGDSIWFVNASSGNNGTLIYQWGLSGDVPVDGKYSGGIGADLGVYRPSNGTWYIRNFSTDLKYNVANKAYQWGLSGDTALSCDFDGDSGRSDLVVYRPTTGTWYVRNSGASTAFDSATVQQWGGISGDRPIPRDYDSDSKCDYTVFRNGSWYVVLSSTSGSEAAIIPWGTTSDVPVPGKYDGDSIVDFAVFRPSNSTWNIRKSNLAGLTSRTISWGLTGDIPVQGDYTGDGKTDIAVFRPSTGTYYILTSESDYATATAQQFGLNGDVPMGDNRGSL